MHVPPLTDTVTVCSQLQTLRDAASATLTWRMQCTHICAEGPVMQQHHPQLMHSICLRKSSTQLHWGQEAYPKHPHPLEDGSWGFWQPRAGLWGSWPPVLSIAW